MSSDSSITLRGTIVPMPRQHNHYKVALSVNNDTEPCEYAIQTRGAGIDLTDMVSTQIEAVCILKDEDEMPVIHIKSYKILDDLDEVDLFEGNE